MEDNKDLSSIVNRRRRMVIFTPSKSKYKRKKKYFAYDTCECMYLLIKDRSTTFDFAFSQFENTTTIQSVGRSSTADVT